jgi:two-component system OmpR family response regulator
MFLAFRRATGCRGWSAALRYGHTGPELNLPRTQASAAPRILVADDEENIADLVSTALGYEGYEVATATTGLATIEAVASFRPDLLMLDVMFPDLDGFEIQRRLGERGLDVPIIFLTARDSMSDKIQGLSGGADDYITKPFSLKEVTLRAKTVLRRVQGGDYAKARLRFADLEMDESTHEVWRGGEAVSLTATEFALLRFLMLNPRMVLSKSTLLRHVWNYHHDAEGTVVETYLSYLRKKVDNKDPRLIHTIRGVGYTLRLPAA